MVSWILERNTIGFASRLFFYKKPATIGLKWDIKVLKIKRHPFKKADLDGWVVGHDPCSRPNEREKEF